MEREGTNIIAVWPGANWLTLEDRPLVIGAHWDVVNGTSGFNDNGSGVAVLLELARVLTASECFKPEHTILFVAFDTEEAGFLETMNSLLLKQNLSIRLFSDPSAHTSLFDASWSHFLPGVG